MDQDQGRLDGHYYYWNDFGIVSGSTDWCTILVPGVATCGLIRI